MTAPDRLRFGRYDYAAFATFVAYAACSLVVPIVLVAMARDLGFPLDRGGMTAGGGLQMLRSVSMCAGMLLCGFAAARWGNRRSVAAALALMGFGILLCAFAPRYALLLPALLLAGLGEGFVEGLGTPLVQNLHEEEPARYVNFTHGFWSLGVLGAVLLFGVLLDRGASWRTVLAVTALFTVPPLLLLLGRQRRHPYPERKEPISARQVCSHAAAVLRERRFWLFFAAMFLAGGGEYCLTFWCASYIQLHFAGTALAGAAATAVFSLGMFLGRTGFGVLVRQHQLRNLLVLAGVGAAAASILLPFLANPAHADKPWLPGLLFGLLFLCGLATAPFWPSIQSHTVDRMPQLDATMVFILLSSAGIPGCGTLTWLMGWVGDRFGLDTAFGLVPACFLLMALLLATPAANRRDPERKTAMPAL